MKEEYWDIFENSGKVTDYLYYKGMCICDSVMNKYTDNTKAEMKTEEKLIESNCSKRNGDYHHACRGIR